MEIPTPEHPAVHAEDAPNTTKAISNAVEAESVVAQTVHDLKSDPVAAEKTVEELAPVVYNTAVGVVKESKAGWKTTEFWLIVAVGVLTEVGTLPIPEHAKAYAAAALAGVYAISRGIAKHGVPDVTPEA